MYGLGSLRSDCVGEDHLPICAFGFECVAPILGPLRILSFKFLVVSKLSVGGVDRRA